MRAPCLWSPASDSFQFGTRYPDLAYVYRLGFGYRIDRGSGLRLGHPQDGVRAGTMHKRLSGLA